MILMLERKLEMFLVNLPCLHPPIFQHFVYYFFKGQAYRLGVCIYRCCYVPLISIYDGLPQLVTSSAGLVVPGKYVMFFLGQNDVQGYYQEIGLHLHPIVRIAIQYGPDVSLMRPMRMKMMMVRRMPKIIHLWYYSADLWGSGFSNSRRSMHTESGAPLTN